MHGETIKLGLDRLYRNAGNYKSTLSNTPEEQRSQRYTVHSSQHAVCEHFRSQCPMLITSAIRKKHIHYK